MTKKLATEATQHAEAHFTLLLVTDTGCEEACALEAARWCDAPTTQHRNVVSLEVSLNDALTLAYRLQTARRVLLRLSDAKNIDALGKTTPDAAVLAACVAESTAFKAECDVLALDAKGNAVQMPLAQELVEGMGDWFNACKVRLSNPDIIVYGVLTPERLWVGIDLVGRSLAKREYRIMLSRRSLKATVAASTIVYSGAKMGESILDPIADDGTLAIECALSLGATSPQHYTKSFAFQAFPALAGRDWVAWRAQEEQRYGNAGAKRDAKTAAKIDDTRIIAYAASLQDMKATRMNAKLAGIEKRLHATKVNVDWMDLKLEERSIDRVITQPIVGGKSLAQAHADKLIDQLFDQAMYILKPKGTMTCITEKPDALFPASERHGFVLATQHDILMGKRPMAILCFEKKKK